VGTLAGIVVVVLILLLLGLLTELVTGAGRRTENDGEEFVTDPLKKPAARHKPAVTRHKPRRAPIPRHLKDAVRKRDGRRCAGRTTRSTSTT
jgi:hypothetical protein